MISTQRPTKATWEKKITQFFLFKEREVKSFLISRTYGKITCKITTHRTTHWALSIQLAEADHTTWATSCHPHKSKTGSQRLFYRGSASTDADSRQVWNHTLGHSLKAKTTAGWLHKTKLHAVLHILSPYTTHASKSLGISITELKKRIFKDTFNCVKEHSKLHLQLWALKSILNDT